MGPLIRVFCFVFGAMTLKEGGSVLFIEGPKREAAGAFVPWVLWFNFLTGFAFLSVGIGLWKKRKWIVRVTAFVAVSSVVVLLTFLIRIAAGGSYEARTLVAMPLRSLVWVGLFFWVNRFERRSLR